MRQPAKSMASTTATTGVSVARIAKPQALPHVNQTSLFASYSASSWFYRLLPSRAFMPICARMQPGCATMGNLAKKGVTPRTQNQLRIVPRSTSAIALSIFILPYDEGFPGLLWRPIGRTYVQFELHPPFPPAGDQP